MGSAEDRQMQAEAKKELMRSKRAQQEVKKSELEKLADEIIAAGQPWTDPDFGPEPKSLVDPAHDKADKIKDLNWKRASEVYPNQSIF